MTMTTRTALFALLLLGGCARPAPTPVAANENRPAAPAADTLPPAPLSAPGTPEGLPDDRTPVSEAPFADTSAQSAANVVQTYFALIEARRFAEARRLRRDDAYLDPIYADYADYHAEVGAPGEIEGAAGSLYVEVPVAVYGRLRNGTPFRERGRIILRRVNDVDGSTPEQRRWHIERSEVAPYIAQ
jgi:hypothetical protein